MKPDSHGQQPWRLLCLRDLLAHSASLDPEALALLAPERQPLSYGRLLQLVNDTESTLRSSGIGPQHRIAVVLPNGPELAACLLAIASSAVCVPLNPAYSSAEFELYFSRLRVDALVVELGMNSAAAEVARFRGVPIIELVPKIMQEAGVFLLKTPTGSQLTSGSATSTDIALLLHTSGTSGKPKIVPYTHCNVVHSAQNIRISLDLTAADRCLNVMPMFHSHGIMTGIMSSIAAGGSIICPPGFYAPRFFSWIESFRPTWYTAVPAMHQSILMRAPNHRDIIARASLRFIRSGSSPLSPHVMKEVEDTFSGPVIEAYATTETSQICSNSLPPRQRKPGSVGISIGTQVAIMDESGTLLAPGLNGDIVVRGANVMQGYEDAAADKSAFRDGWFMTGDRGWLDDEGYLFISGTSKEIINRGGEKISPREVDEALLSHPAVAEAVTFAVPDRRLGQDVAAAVVASQPVTESELFEFVNRKLADFKVPRHILFVEKIAKTSTGKPQRFGLAAEFGFTEMACEGVAEPASHVPPRDLIEKRLCAIWAEVLGVSDVGVHDNFFCSGGDSLLAASMLSRIAAVFKKDLALRSLFAAPTVAQLAGLISNQPEAESELQSVSSCGSD